MSTENEFQPGDVVRLKSGGPDMTVEQCGERAMIGGRAVWCVWFEYSGRNQVLKRDTFPPAALEKADQAGPVTMGFVQRG